MGTVSFDAAKLKEQVFSDGGCCSFKSLAAAEKMVTHGIIKVNNK
jgi:hypothetical protein